MTNNPEQLRSAATALLSAAEMLEHNDAIFKGKWKKGSKAWSGDFIERTVQEGLAPITGAQSEIAPTSVDAKHFWSKGMSQEQRDDKSYADALADHIEACFKVAGNESFCIRREDAPTVIAALRTRSAVARRSTRTLAQRMSAHDDGSGLVPLHAVLTVIEEAEGEHCPEDYGFVEYVGVLKRRVGERDVQIANLTTAITAMNSMPSATAPRRCREGADRDCSPACDEKSRTYCSWKGF